MSTETTDPLRAEHETLQRAIKASRTRSAATSETAFVREMWAVMDEYRAARAGGLSLAEAAKGIEAALRELWPRRPSKFGAACDACDDSGWATLICRADERCGRQSCALGHPSREHRYVVACSCRHGDRHTRRVGASATVEAAMRHKRPKALSPFSGGGR